MKSSRRKVISTNILGKGEAYRHLALAESVNLPLLLVGAVGVAKTAVVTSWSKANIEEYNIETNKFELNRKDDKKVFIIETDTDTRSKEIKGHIDMKELAINNNYSIRTPIKDYPYLVFNEIDKASNAFRNACLSIMNEKVLFNGEETVPCNWELFVATCNVIPEDEVNSPFWDRFVIKMNVDRLSSGEMAQYYKDGDKNAKYEYIISIPTAEEIESVVVPTHKLVKALEVLYDKCTDRVLTYLPTLTKAISFIWNCSVDKALVKAAEIIAGKNIANLLSQRIISNHLKNLFNEIDLLRMESDHDRIRNRIGVISKTVGELESKGELTSDEIQELVERLEEIVNSHAMLSENVTDETDKEDLAQPSA